MSFQEHDIGKGLRANLVDVTSFLRGFWFLKLENYKVINDFLRRFKLPKLRKMHFNQSILLDFDKIIAI